MVQVTLGIGSNLNPADNIRSCLDALLLQFRDLKLSSVFESRAEGAPDSAPYLNMAVAFDTELPPDELLRRLKQLEAKHGRNRADSEAGRVSLDLDLLSYGDKQGAFAGVTLPRPGITEFAYVLWPLSQVAGGTRHPGRGQSYAALWRDFDGERNGIRPVDFEWHGRKLSSA